MKELYYAADRLYNVNEINEKLNQGINVILDRYVESNMAHQGGKLMTKEERNDMFEWLEKLEFELIGLPRPDGVIFLHMPYEQACILKKDRNEAPDGHELNPEHLINAEKTYLELAEKYSFITIPCNDGESVRSIEDISTDVLKVAKEIINGR